MPSTGPAWVVLAGARSGPCSIATPSNPICPAAVEGVLEEVAELEVGLDEELLLPQPPRTAASARTGMA
jgi:hypothetical protein